MNPVLYWDRYKSYTLSLFFNDFIPYITEFNENIPPHTLYEEYGVFKKTLESISLEQFQIPGHNYTFERINRYFSVFLEKRYFTVEELARCKVSSRMKYFVYASTLLYINYLPEPFMTDSYVFQNIAFVVAYLFKCTKPPIASLECIALYTTLLRYDTYDSNVQRGINKIVTQDISEFYFKSNEIYAHYNSFQEKNYTPPTNYNLHIYKGARICDLFLYNFLGYMKLIYYCIKIRIRNDEIKFSKNKFSHVLIAEDIKTWVYNMVINQISKLVRNEGKETLAQFSQKRSYSLLFLKGKPYHSYRILIETLKDIPINLDSPQYYATINTLRKKMEMVYLGFGHSLL